MMRLKLCSCGNVVDGKSNGCERCGRGKKRARLGTTEAGYDYDWKKLSERYRKENPLCVVCAERGIATAAEEVHHVVPITEAPWLRLAVSNLMALCVVCHRLIEEERRQADSSR